MDILESDKLKIRILQCLDNQTTDISLNSLKKKVGAINYKSVKRNCDFLELADLIIIEKQKIEDVNYNMISISNTGREFVQKFNEIKNSLEE